jgi:Transcription-repair coupling factor (superfamily II helicase)
MDLYRRIARIRTEDEADDMVDELIDRYGDPPRPVNNLISVALLRARAAENGITSIIQKAGVLYFYLKDFDLIQVSKLCSDEVFKGKLVFSAAEPTCLSIKVAKSVDVMKLSQMVVKRFGAARGK